MRDGRRMQDAVIRRDRIDVGEVAQRHRHQVAVGERGALGAAGGAAGVEEPRRIGRSSVDRRSRGCAGQVEPLRARGHDDRSHCVDRLKDRFDVTGVVIVGDHSDRPAVVHDVLDLGTMQPRVDRYRNEPGMPNR